MLTLQSRPQLSGSCLPVQLQLFPFPALHLINVAAVYHLYFPIMLLFSNAALVLRIPFILLFTWLAKHSEYLMNKGKKGGRKD